ncbi:nucleotidyltransferase family protein [Chlamydiota bacterium]
MQENGREKATINQNFLLASFFSTGEIQKTLFMQHQAMLDWNRLFALSQRHKVSIIFIRGIERCGIVSLLPHSVQNRIGSIKRAAQKRIHNANTTLRQLHEGFTREKIPFMVLKGSVFAEELYSEAMVRPFHDIDLLVSPQFIKKTEDIIISLGYQFYFPPVQIMGFIPFWHIPRRTQGVYDPNIVKKLYRRYHFHFPFVLPQKDRRVPIDLHWQLFWPGVMKGKPECIWKYKRTVFLKNLNVNTLDMKATLLYLAVKIAIDGPEDFKLINICDFFRCLNVYQDHLDIHELRQMAENWGVTRYFQFSLWLTKKIFRVEVPSVFTSCPPNSGYRYRYFQRSVTSLVLLRFPEQYRQNIFKVIICSFLWDLGILRVPRRAVKEMVRCIILFFKKRWVKKNASY